MNKLPIFACIAAIGTFGSSAYASSLVVNGSFENTANFVDNHGQDTDSLTPGSTDMTGWTVSAGHNVAWIGPTNPFGPGGSHAPASDGGYFLDLTDYQDGSPFGGVSQVINTHAGEAYKLTFDLGSSSLYGLPDGLQASAGSTSQTFTSTQNGTENWEPESMFFIGASGPTTTISFQGSSGSAYIGLDNVSVAAVPLPATLPLLAGGVGALGVFGRWRKKRAATSLAST
jgi:hypothetical protein